MSVDDNKNYPEWYNSEERRRLLKEYNWTPDTFHFNPMEPYKKSEETLKEFEARPEVREAFKRLHEMPCWTVEEALEAFKNIPLPEYQVIGYGYIAKGSGKLVVVDESHSHHDHVFPIYKKVWVDKDENE